MNNKIVDSILDSYSTHGIINPNDGVHFPPQLLIEKLFDLIKEILFPGFFGFDALNNRNLKELTSNRVHQISEILFNEIQKCIFWNPDSELEILSKQDAEIRAKEIVTQFLNKLPFLREVLIDDAKAMFKGDPAANSMIEVLLSYPGFQAIMAYRVAHELHLQSVPIIPRMITEIVHFQTGIDIHPGAKIGRHFCVDHGTGVVIGETSNIGDYVKLYQGVTLGAFSVNDRQKPKKRHPTIEDHVTIYAMSTILGGDTVVGKHSVVGGNVWLTRSIPENSKIYLSEDFDSTYTLLQSKKKS